MVSYCEVGIDSPSENYGPAANQQSKLTTSWAEGRSRSSRIHVHLGSPQVYVTSRQPLQAGHIQDGHLVPCQAESLQASELLQHGGHTGEGVEGQAEVGEAL